MHPYEHLLQLKSIGHQRDFLPAELAVLEEYLQSPRDDVSILSASALVLSKPSALSARAVEVFWERMDSLNQRGAVPEFVQFLVSEALVSCPGLRSEMRQCELEEFLYFLAGSPVRDKSNFSGIMSLSLLKNPVAIERIEKRIAESQ